MKNKIVVNRQIILHAFLVSIITMLLFVMLLISPYQYSWEDSLKQLSDDNILVLNVVSTLICVLSMVGFIYSKKQDRKKIGIGYLVFIILGVVKILSNLCLNFCS